MEEGEKQPQPCCSTTSTHTSATPRHSQQQEILTQHHILSWERCGTSIASYSRTAWGMSTFYKHSSELSKALRGVITEGNNLS